MTAPTPESNLRGMGMVVINAAFVLQMSWLPTIFYLEGSDSVTPALAVSIHWLALGFLIAAPLAYGLRLRLRGAGTDELKTWFLRCQLPLTIYALLVRGTVKFVPSLTLGVIAGMMIAGILLVLYGVAMRKEGAPA